MFGRRSFRSYLLVWNLKTDLLVSLQVTNPILWLFMHPFMCAVMLSQGIYTNLQMGFCYIYTISRHVLFLSVHLRVSPSLPCVCSYNLTIMTTMTFQALIIPLSRVDLVSDYVKYVGMKLHCRFITSLLYLTGSKTL